MSVRAKNVRSFACVTSTRGAVRKRSNRGNSSIGVIGHSRTGLLVAEDSNDDSYRVLACSKSNLGPKPKSLRFILDPKDDVVASAGAANAASRRIILFSRP
jgi:hypothetical protein